MIKLEKCSGALSKIKKMTLRVTRCALYEDGIAALLTVVIIGAASLIMAYSASILGLGELELGFDSGQGEEAFAVADGCIEESFRKLKLDDLYSGETLNLGDNSCIISVSGGGSTRIITAVSTVSNYHKKIEANITISSGNIVLDSWEEKE